jgi:tRNA pseudouridine32 synthase/23S rRNA pseudouridine746 synthase
MASFMAMEDELQQLFFPLEGSYPNPSTFPNPMNFPHDPLGQEAAQVLLQNFSEEFCSEEGMDRILHKEGKMLGVLVVEKSNGQRGFLRGFSGKLFGKTLVPGFVPPVYDLQHPGSFYLPKEQELVELSKRIKAIEQSAPYQRAHDLWQKTSEESQYAIQEARDQAKESKRERRAQRQKLQGLDQSEAMTLAASLDQESQRSHFALKDLVKDWEKKVADAKKQFDLYDEPLQDLILRRKNQSKILQQRVFSHYTFLNRQGVTKSLWDIFSQEKEGWPPTGAGECAGPKLLQSAFRLNLQPLSLVEFWYGAPLASQVRRHGHYYGSCRGKCRPILRHMLQGIPIEPELVPKTNQKSFTILYQDDQIIAIDKPPGVLSVPGREHDGSVATWVKSEFMDITGPMVLHRLDMATSGVLLFARNPQAFHYLQKQFMAHKINKTYLAILEGQPAKDHGLINLPLGPDWNYRPSQKVDLTGGKKARTRYRVLERKNNRCLISFFPETGRTHQLRIHASHQRGLNAPIQGDQLYGKGGGRLMLHASKIQFNHPKTHRPFKVFSPSPFPREIDN